MLRRYYWTMAKRYGRKKGKFKNSFEEKLFNDLEKVLGKGTVEYEKETLTYKIDEVRRYTPDFKIRPRVFIEGKGKWTATDRKKMLLVINQWPDCKFYMYFVSGNKRLSKVSKTTYGDWCTNRGIEWSDQSKGVPRTWILKPTRSGDTTSNK